MTRAAAVIGLLCGSYFVLGQVSLVFALITGLYVDHGQNLPSGFTVSCLVALGGIALAGALWVADQLSARSRGGLT